MRLRVRDTVYDLDTEHITIGEARALKKHSGMGIHEIFLGLRRGDPDAAASIVFLALMRAGEKPVWRDLDDLDLVDDVVLLDEDGDRDEDEGGDGDGDEGVTADPTVAGGTTRRPGSSATSQRSRSSTTSRRGRSTTSR